MERKPTESGAGTAGSAPAPPGQFRWVICALLFFSVAVNYIDRLVIGILKKPLSEQLGWNDADYGHIAAAFSFAYAFGYLFGGRLLDRLGVKRGLPLFVLAWSLAAVAHGLCGLIGVTEQFRMSYPWFSWAEKGIVWLTLAMPLTAAGFMLARIALGLSQGDNFPGAIKAVAEWYPVKERALATGCSTPAPTPGRSVSHRRAVDFPALRLATTFYLTGATGFVWVAAWWWLYEAPEKHPRLSTGRTRLYQGRAAAGGAKGGQDALAHFARLPGGVGVPAGRHPRGAAWGFYQFFVPDFLDKGFELELQAIGWWTGAFFGIAAVGGVAGGWLAGRLMGRGWSVNAARKVSLLICALAVVPVFLAPFAGSVWLAVLIVGIAGSAHQGWSANLFSVVSDTMPKETISRSSALAGSSPISRGDSSTNSRFDLQRTGSYVLVFGYFSGMYVLSLIAIQLLVPKICMSDTK